MRRLAVFLMLILLSAGTAFAERITVATNPEWPPMDMLDADGRHVGYELELLTSVAKSAGLEVRFVRSGWEDIFTLLEDGRCDLVAACVTVTPERSRKFLFSRPFHTIRQALTVPIGSFIKEAADLEGRRIGVQVSTTASTLVRKLKSNFTVVSYDTAGQAFADLKAKRVDAVMCDDTVARFYAARQAGHAGTLRIALTVDVAEQIAFLTRADNRKLMSRLDKALGKAMEDGTEKAIREKWFGADPMIR